MADPRSSAVHDQEARNAEDTALEAEAAASDEPEWETLEADLDEALAETLPGGHRRPEGQAGGEEDDWVGDPEDARRRHHQEQDNLRRQGAGTPEQRLASGWADPEDPSQAMFEETINEDEQNLADKRT